MLNTPVALIIFRRPDLTARALERIAAVRPTRLFVIADGPRPGNPGDVEECAAARAVIDRVDWDCDVVRNFSDVNLGCGRRPASGISWVFEQVTEAIILEDDCLPHESFFHFCAELLERYHDDERVMHIGGTQLSTRTMETPNSYYFSHFQGVWGWASWRRAWNHYDYGMKLWPQLRGTAFLEILEEKAAVDAWSSWFDTVSATDNVDIWDHQWSFACWANSGLSILPRHNLVTNVGYGAAATHTAQSEDPYINLPAREMLFPLVHPPTVLHDRDLERIFMREVVLPHLGTPPPSLRSRIRQRISTHVPASVRQLIAGMRSANPAAIKN